MNNTKKLTLKICESAIMIALATILSLLKIVDLPYGGSITMASMLPILIIAYRHGTLWGLLTGLVHGALQLLLGTSALSYVTGAASIIAVILLDYILAFAFIGIAGAFKGIKNQKIGILLSGAVVSLIRYACHVISGATVWAGLSIPTASALTYSFIYNATYMIPEALVLCAAAFYLAGAIDFRSPRLSAAQREQEAGVPRLATLTAGAAILCAFIYDVSAVFSKLQDTESGEFAFSEGIARVNWMGVIIVTAGALIVSVLVMLIGRNLKKSR